MNETNSSMHEVQTIRDSSTKGLLLDGDGSSYDVTMGDPSTLGKRSASYNVTHKEHLVLPLDNNSGAMVPIGNTSNIIDKFDGSEGELESGSAGTPQKNARRKMLKGIDGEPIDNNKTNVSAASLAEDRRVQ